jgi:hypothetical protein
VINRLLRPSWRNINEAARVFGYREPYAVIKCGRCAGEFHGVGPCPSKERL